MLDILVDADGCFIFVVIYMVTRGLGDIGTGQLSHWKSDGHRYVPYFNSLKI